MSPRGYQQLDIAVTGTLERCWELLLLLLVQAGISVSRRKKKPQSFLEANSALDASPEARSCCAPCAN